MILQSSKSGTNHEQDESQSELKSFGDFFTGNDQQVEENAIPNFDNLPSNSMDDDGDGSLRESVDKKSETEQSEEQL